MLHVIDIGIGMAVGATLTAGLLSCINREKLRAFDLLLGLTLVSMAIMLAAIYEHWGLR